MYVISYKIGDVFLYLAEKRLDLSYPNNFKYHWSPSIRDAQYFESPEEAKIFWKVSSDRGLIDSVNGEDLAIRKMIFTKVRKFELS